MSFSEADRNIQNPFEDTDSRQHKPTDKKKWMSRMDEKKKKT